MTIKFLGLIFDRKLTWNLHLQDLATRCKSTLNIMRCLSSTKWEAEKEMLIRLYKTLILSKMDYMVYYSARPTHLKLLDSIQNIGLRLATGVFRTSPIRALEVEAGIPPLFLRRERLMQNYGISIKTQSQLPNYNILHEPPNEVYNLRPTITKPLTARLNRHIMYNGIYFKSFTPDPPWQFEILIHNLELTTYIKRNKSDPDKN